jgi:hypothetical protein
MLTCSPLDTAGDFYGVTVSVLLFVTLSDVAEMVTVVEVVTFVVVMVNVPEVSPPAMMTLGGTLATDGLSLVSLTASPTEHAG